MAEYEQQEAWQKADARVLGQILAAQNIIFTLPGVTRIAEFYAQTLISIPGITACRVCLGGRSVQAGEMASSVCAQCEALHATAWEDNTFSPADSNFKCKLADQPEIQFITIDSFQHHFGFFVLKIKHAAGFEVYHPFIINLANYLAITLENHWQKELLQKAQADLERKVEERTHDLKVANADLQREITHRKRAEEALREQFSTLRSIIDSTNALIFSVDREYRYTSFNRSHTAAMQALYGAEIETGHSLLGYMTVAGDREKAQRNLDRALAGEQIVEESYSGDELWSRRYFQVAHSPIRTETGEIIGVAMLAQDITERRAMELALAVQEKEYRTLVEHSPDLIVRYDTDLRRTYVNPAWEKASGLSAEEVVNVPPADISKVPQVTVNEYMEKLREALTTRNPQSIEFSWVNAYGVTLYLDYVIVPEYDQYGEITSLLSVGHDLTERRQAEEGLRRRNRELQALSNCNQALLRAIDEQTLLNEICRIVCDEAGYRLAWVGYVEHDEAKTVWPVAWAGDDSGYIANARLSWAADSERGQGPAGNAIRSGEIIYVQDFATDPRMDPWREDALRRGYRSEIALPLKDENAQVFGVLLIYSTKVNIVTPDEIWLMEELAGDLAFGIITLRSGIRRKQVEEALRESEEQYRFLIQKVHTGIVLHDGQGRILASNPLAQHLLGLSDEQLLGKALVEPTWRFLREDGSAMPITEYPVSLVLSSRQPLRGYIAGIVHPDKLIWVLINAEPEFAARGKIVRVIVSFIDITEKKRAEESLRKLSRAVEQSPVSIIITDTTGAIEYVNPRFTELTGYTLEEVRGQNPRVLKSGETPSEEYRALWETILSGRAWQGEFCNKKKNGELYWEWTYISPVSDQAGVITNFVAAKENITERKQAEQELERYREHLEELVTERTAELRTANEQLRVL
ncbi:MAG TPA: PAS domain S-box protein, partial [Aggregatilineaceae bacterium]|nr:PAS domain S-box protein [Aggregatilineaceae bacterium]